MNKFTVRGCHYGEKTFPSLNNYIAELGKNPLAGGRMKRKYMDIVIKSIKFEFDGNVREIKGFEMGVFFRADDTKCTFDSTSGLVKSLVKDGVKQSPSLYPHESVQAAELPKLYQ